VIFEPIFLVKEGAPFEKALRNLEILFAIFVIYKKMLIYQLAFLIPGIIP
jgi:hypothetical protein